MRRVLSILALVLLAACGAQTPTEPEPRPFGAVQPPRFGDADPHPWAGRRPESYAVHGIDTSRFQGAVDWRAARAAGVNFAFLKATEGGDLLDPAFKDNWRAADKAGVARGAYHFWYHCRPGLEQAQWFIYNVPKSPRALPPVLDLEWTPFSPTCTRRPPGAEVRAEAEIFMTALQRYYGQKPIIYTSIDFFEDNEMWRLKGHEFWLRSVAGHPKDVYAGQHWTFWQYSSTGLVPGIGGETDLNVFAGSAAEWQAWLETRAR